MNKNIILTIVAAVVIFAGIGYFAWNADRATPFVEPSESTKTLFVGDGCPHCAKVEQYIADNKLADKVQYETREVFKNADNAGVLKKRAEKCGLDLQNIGVPLFWDGQKCYNGDVEITEYFKQFLPVTAANASSTK